MPEFVINSGGMGVTASDQAQECVQLGYASYVFNPSCWGTSYTDWQAQFYGPNAALNIATPAPSAPSNLVTPGIDLPGDAGQQAQGAVDQQIAGIITTAQQANVALNPPTADSCQTLSNGWPYPFGNMDCPTMLMWGLGALAAIMIVPRFFK